MRKPAVFLAVVGALAAVAGVVETARSHVASADARPARVELLGHASPGGGYSGDVYAHRGYAYLSSWRGRDCPAQGVRIYDVRNPRRPRRLSSFADAASDASVAGTWTEKTIVQRVATPAFTGDLAVTTFQSCRSGSFQGFGLYDVTTPDRPRKLSLFETSPRGSHEIWLQTRGNRAYVYTAIPASELLSSRDYDPQTREATVPGEPDFRIVDVSDPRRPVQVGAWGAWSALGIHPNAGRGRRLRRNLVHSVITNAAATRAYLSYWDLGTVILDIATPSRPRYLGRTRFVASEPEGDAHSAALARGETLLVETHETAGGYPTFWDVSDPRRPRRLGAFQPVRTAAAGARMPFSSSVHDAKVRGTRAYFSWYTNGVLVADISRPARPRLLARFLPRPSADPEGSICDAGPCRQVWGVALSGESVLASDMVSGLWIFRVR